MKAISALLALLSLSLFSAQAGRYPTTGTQTFTYADGVTALGDGTVLSSTFPGTFAKIFGNALLLSNQSFSGNKSSWRLPNLDPGNAIQSFDATCMVRMGKSGTSAPASGFALNFGAIPTTGEGSADIGFGMAGGITISFDTFPDTANDHPSIDVYCNNTVIGSFPATNLTETAAVTAGSYTLTNPVTGGTTAAINYNSSITTVQSRMRAVSGWGSVVVSGTVGAYVVTNGAVGSYVTPTGNGALLTGTGFAPGYAAVTINNTVDGTPTTAEIWTISYAGKGFVYDATYRPLVIHWDYDGLDLTYNGVTVFTNLQTPGFAPSSGNIFAFTAGTGSSGAQDTAIDDLVVQTTPTSPPNTGGPIISEFMAENKDTLEDEDMDAPDWIEIYNGQNASVNLAGYKLTQGVATWTFPAVTIPAYGHLVVFASGKNRTVNLALLHTNFTLPKAGGTFSLSNPSNVVVSSWTYPNQYEDVSYGLKYQGGVSGFLSPVSPGAPTLYSYIVAPAGPAEDVVWSRTGGLITGSTTITTSAPVAPNSVIRYTEDDTEPTSGSSLFPGSKTVTATTRLRARVFTDGRLPGPVSSRALLLLDSSLTNYNGSNQPFKSHLPLVVLDSFGTNVDGVTDSSQPRPHRLTYGVVIDKDVTGFADITSPTPNWQGRGGTHVRGDSSSGFPQKSYAWETWDNANNDKDAALLDFPPESDWALYGPYTDKTFIRNLVTFTKMRELHGDANGFAVRTRMVEVIFNQDVNQPVSYNDYRGLYILMERIKRGKDRTNIAKLTDLVTDPAMITGGYIFRRDRLSSDGNTALPVGMHAHTPSILNSAQTTYLSNYINTFNNALNGANFADPALGYAPYIDVNSFIENWWFVEITKQIDGYRLSTYFTKDRGGKIFATPIWDYNLSLGNADYATGDQYAGWYWNQTDSYWWARLRQDPNYELTNWDRYWQMRKTIFSTTSLQASMDEYKLMATNGNTNPVSNNMSLAAGQPSTLENAAQRHYRKHQILGTYVWPNAGGNGLVPTLDPRPWQVNTTYQSEVDWMKTWIGQRLNWIDDQNFSGSVIYRPVNLSAASGSVPAGTQISLSRYTGTAPAGYSYATGGTIYYTMDGSDPRSPAAPVVENVLLAGTGDACKWIVPNAGNGGFTLTAAAGAQQWTNYTDPPNIANWTSGTTGVGYDTATDYISLIGANSNTGSQMNGINATCYIRLSFNIPSQATLDSMNYLKLSMKYDDGYRAYLNGTLVSARNDSDPSITTDPSTAVANVTHDDVLALVYEDNDITSVGKPALRVGTNVLAIHGLNAPATSSDLLFVARLVWATATPSGGTGGIAYTGAIPLTTSGTINARLLANGVWSPLTTGTYVVDAVPASAANIVISEIHYHPTNATPAEVTAGFTSASNFEFIELLNVSAQNVDLTNCAFTDGIVYSFGAENPSALTLAPGGRAIVVANQAAFLSRNGSNPNVRILGQFTGSLSNGGENITLLAANTNVIANFTYGTAEPWPVDADGPGYSLLLNNPAANPAYGNGASWRSSSLIGGSPGVINSSTFTGSTFGDTDNDGHSDFLEYALGTSLNNANSTPITSHAYIVDPDGAAPGTYLSFQYTRNLSADGVVVTPQQSSDLNNWSSAGIVYVSTVNQGDGTALVTCRSEAPITGPATRSYLRVLATAVP